ncbi:MAG: GH3 auxin-responsive promoter family protein [Promethearchaeota archaeon]
MSTKQLIHIIYDRYCKPRLKQLEDPLGTQEKILRKILSRAKDTAFGKQHGFADIASIDEFQRHIPVTTYDYMQPFVARTMAGEENILFPDKTMCMLVTSGTTGTPKLYPFSEYRVKEFIFGAFETTGYYVVHTGNYDLMEGKRLTFPAPPSLGEKIGQYDVAFYSGALTVAPIPPELQKLLEGRESRRVPPREVDTILDWDKKFYLTARYAVAADVRSAVGLTSNMVSLLRKISTEYLDRLLADPELDAETKARLRDVSTDGVLNLQELWPKLSLLISSGVSVTPFRRIIRKLIGDVDIWEGYLATEAELGGMIFPDKGMIPNISRVFFEFIADDVEGAEPIPLSDVKLRTPYRVLITTFGGFYRYDIGDLVEFTDIQTPVFTVISRKKSIVSLAGERLSEEIILRVLERACEQRGIGFIDFALLPEITEDVIRYHIFIEFTEPPDDLEEFTGDIDARLARANIHYAAQRQANVLHLPVIIPVQPGGFEVLLRKMKKVVGQTKVPRRLTPDLIQMIPTLKTK